MQTQWPTFHALMHCHCCVNVGIQRHFWLTIWCTVIIFGLYLPPNMYANIVLLFWEHDLHVKVHADRRRQVRQRLPRVSYKVRLLTDWLIVLRLTTRQPLWVILCLWEKREWRDSRGGEREGQGRKRKMNEKEETEEKKTFSLHP